MAGENPVGTFNQPDFEADTATLYKTSIDNSIKAMHRVGGAFAPHETYEGSPSALTMKVTVDAGHIRSGVTLTEVAAQTTAALVAPVSNPRIDRIVGDVSTGAISVVAGAEAASPSAPAIAAGKFPIAQVLLTVGMTAITNQAITDERALAVNADSIIDGAVTQDKIGDGAVTQAKMASGVAIEIDSSDGSPAVYPGLRIKILNIGAWDMDAAVSVEVVDGIEHKKIRHISVLILSDAGVGAGLLNGTSAATSVADGNIYFLDSTHIRLYRLTGGLYDSTSFNDAAMNRGYVTILYDENG